MATTRALEPVALPSFDFELRCPTTIDHRPSAAAATAVVSGSGGKDGGRLDLNLAGKFRTMISRHIQFHVAIIWREEIWRQFTIQALLTRGSPGNHVECHFHSSARTDTEDVDNANNNYRCGSLFDMNILRILLNCLLKVLLFSVLESNCCHPERHSSKGSTRSCTGHDIPQSQCTDLHQSSSNIQSFQSSTIIYSLCLMLLQHQLLKLRLRSVLSTIEILFCYSFRCCYLIWRQYWKFGV